ncbi:MAG: 5-amino-6-(5-phosphoribosylamino)uracil reductase [Nitrosopumilales archaeon]|jgi:2,5-diamino-6-(ribosylamino)-4(3H)-pyrimidinone 5'-phosphate reductase|nr:MAG: 5-amino-6-(5-phosphoribosylamino)uracil reductase [Nitrosopumilales archaeon]
MAKSRPHVILSAAISVDGKIATKTGDSNLSSKIDKIRVHKLRSKVDAILIGQNTLRRDDPILSVRYAKGRNPIRIILDSRGKISSKSKIIKTCNKIPTILAVSKNISNKNLQRLKKYPLEIIVTGENKVNLKQLLKQLEKRKIKKLLLEGGGTVNWEFIKQGLFDEIIVTVTPFLIGGTKSISLVQGLGFSKISKSTKLKLKKIKQQKNELVLHYTKL